MKSQENKKILDIFNIIEKLTEKEKIIKSLFSRIKKYIAKIPEIKEYFSFLIKYQPTEFDFMIDNMNEYDKYLDLILKNIEHLKNNIYNIFPENMKRNIIYSDDILHSIIKIIKNNKNCYFDSLFFKAKFGDKYLNILNLEEKSELKNFLISKNDSSDNDSINIINDITYDNLKFCKDNELLINALKMHKITDKLLKLCSTNMDLENLSESDLKSLYEILKEHVKQHSSGKNAEIYLIYFKKIKNLKDFLKIITIFGLCNFEEEAINTQINKFWELFDSEKCFSEDIVLSFYYMFLLLKKNNDSKSLEFIKKVNDIENYEFIINLYEKILQKKEKLNDELKKEIFNFYIDRTFEEKYHSVELKNTYLFLKEYYAEKIIEINDFYKNSKEIIGIFNVFNFLNVNKDFKNTNFYINSYNNFNRFLDSIEKNEINFFQLISLLDITKKSELNQKIKSFDFNEEKRNNLLKNIESKYQLVLDIKTKIEACKNYLDLFPSSEN